jgi:hypothetical protein
MLHPSVSLILLFSRFVAKILIPVQSQVTLVAAVSYFSIDSGNA